jgi:uncharacterized Zn finger protein
MSVESAWGHFFKPEVRKAGTDFFNDGVVVLSVTSDTGIQGYVKGTASSKVVLKAESIGSPTFYADCSCPPSTKGMLCKHIWAVLLQTEKKYPDFLDSKRNIEKLEKAPQPESPYKAKQDAYRKQQYEKQKARAKEQRLAKKNSKRAPAEPVSLPAAVESAFEFFSQNGFPMENPVDEEVLKDAKKKLSRIFHPDKGGTHEEAVVLNEHYDVLAHFSGF